MSPAADSATPSSSRAGITTAADGQRHIPSSTRADGSQRKEIKIRPGYRPPEDVEVYKNRTAAAWKNRGSGGIPGAAAAADEDSSKGNSASNKNAKRKEARKKAKAAGDNTKDSNDAPNGVAKEPETRNDGNDQCKPELKPEADNEADKDKKAKRLKKKLREARELQAKKEKGEGLLQEQFEKVIRINELMRDLEKLGVKDESEEGKAA
ncbi:MAG: hypothetical protein MMC23_007072 [Stictis urceolatum]|nr:hypothetical protein [Stictis urceolata]